MDDFQRILISGAFLGLMVACSIIYSTGYDGSVAGMKIGPHAPLFKLAGK